MKKVLFIIGALFLSFGLAQGATILFPTGGGTGIGTATAGDVGDCLKVLDDSPFTYELGSCGTGGGGGGGGGAWATTTNNLLTYLTTQWTALIGGTATTSDSRLEVGGGVTIYGVATSSTVSATSTLATSTFANALQIGSTARSAKFAITAAASSSASETVGGLMNLNMSTFGGAGFVLSTQGAAGSGRLMSLVCGNNAYDTNCLHVRSTGTATTLNVVGHPTGQGVLKVASDGVGDANASLISLDASLEGFLGQTFFFKCGSSTKCWNMRTSANDEVMTVLGTGYMGLGTTSPYAKLSVTGQTVSEYFTATSTAFTSSFPLATVSTVLTIPNGTGPTADDPGEIAHDTSDNQVILDDFVIGRATERIWGVTIASTSPYVIGGTNLPIPDQADGYTMTSITCRTVSGTSIAITITDGSNATESITCDSDGAADDGSITNAGVTAGEDMAIDFGTVTGAVDSISISVFGQWTRE